MRLTEDRLLLTCLRCLATFNEIAGAACIYAITSRREQPRSSGGRIRSGPCGAKLDAIGSISPARHCVKRFAPDRRFACLVPHDISWGLDDPDALEGHLGTWPRHFEHRLRRCLNILVAIAGPHDWMRGAGIEQTFTEEDVADVDADHLADDQMVAGRLPFQVEQINNA